jgi:hypothetical protein
VLLAFVLFNKTFSPQYVLWLAPLVAVVPLAGRPRRIFQLGFIGVCYLTMLIFPRFSGEVIGELRPLPSHPAASTGASVFGTGLLLARLLLLVFLVATLAVNLIGRAGRIRRSPVNPRIATSACAAEHPAQQPALRQRRAA